MRSRQQRTSWARRWRLGVLPWSRRLLGGLALGGALVGARLLGGRRAPGGRRGRRAAPARRGAFGGGWRRPGRGRTVLGQSRAGARHRPLGRWRDRPGRGRALVGGGQGRRGRGAGGGRPFAGAVELPAEAGDDVGAAALVGLELQQPFAL